MRAEHAGQDHVTDGTADGPATRGQAVEAGAERVHVAGHGGQTGREDRPAVQGARGLRVARARSVRRAAYRPVQGRPVPRRPHDGRTARGQGETR